MPLEKVHFLQKGLKPALSLVIAVTAVCVHNGNGNIPASYKGICNGGAVFP